MLGLWVLAALMAAGLTAALFLRGEPGADVADYIEEVNEAQKASATRYGAVERAYRELRLEPAELDEQLPRLRESARELTALRLRIERVPAPPDARVLRQRIVAFFVQQERLALELLAVAGYLPELAATEQPVASASESLRRSLREAATPAAQADALARYAAVLNGTARELLEVDPPALLAPAHAQYVSRLRSYGEAADTLAQGIRAGDERATERAARQLEAASVPASQRAQKVAIEAYNARVRRVDALAADVERERLRLEDVI